MPGAGIGFLKARTWKAGPRRRKLRTGVIVPASVRRRKLRTGVTLAQAVKTIVKGQAETKYVARSPINNFGYENDIPSLGEWTVALPPVTQGPGEIQRIGDKMSPVSHRTKLNIRIANTNTSGSGDPPVYGANTTPLDITVYIVYGYIKSLKTYQGSTAVSGLSTVVQGSTEATLAMSNLLDKGDGTYVTFDGSAPNAMLPFNKTLVDMKIKKVRLHKPAGWVNSGANAVDPSAKEQSSDGIHARDVTLKWSPPAKMLFNLDTDVYPNNYAPVFAVGYVYNDSISNPSSVAYTYGGVEYTAQNQLWFKDM